MSKEVLATVAGIEITDDQIDAFIEKLPKEQQLYIHYPAFRNQVLEQVINLSLFMKLAEDKKLDETDIYKQYIEQARRDILSQLAINSTVEGLSVTDEEVKKFYEENQSQFGKGETVSAKHILVDSKEKCLSVLEEVKSGAKTFEDAAKEYSSCGSAPRGGDLGEFGHGQMVAEFDQAAFAANVGEITGPIKTQFGYHLIMVYEKSQADIPPFEAVRQQAERSCLSAKQQVAYNAALAELRAKYM